MTKSQEDRCTNFEQVKNPALAMQNAVLRFVRGYRGPRQNAVTQERIFKHFAATKREFVNDAILTLLVDDKLDALRAGLHRRSGTVFEVCVEE